MSLFQENLLREKGGGYSSFYLQTLYHVNHQCLYEAAPEHAELIQGK